jgi:hypothetical protein
MPIDETNRRKGLEERSGAGECPRGDKVIGVKPDDEVTHSFGQADIEGADMTKILVVPKVANPRVPLRQSTGHLRGGVGRGVVDDDDLHTNADLAKSTAHGFLEEPAVVVAGHHHREEPLLLWAHRLGRSGTRHRLQGARTKVV